MDEQIYGCVCGHTHRADGSCSVCVSCIFTDGEPKNQDYWRGYRAVESQVAALVRQKADDDLAFNHANEVVGKLESELAQARAELARMREPVRDEEASDTVLSAMKMEFGGTYQEAMDALITARASTETKTKERL